MLPVDVLGLVVLALIAILSPTFAKVTVVVPTMKSCQLIPSVVYSRDNEGAAPQAPIPTVEFVYSAVKVKPTIYTLVMWGTIALSDHPLATIHWSYNDSGT